MTSSFRKFQFLKQWHHGSNGKLCYHELFSISVLFLSLSENKTVSLYNQAISSTSARFIFEAIQSYELLQSLTEMYNTKLQRVLEQKKWTKIRFWSLIST